jgi:hypothetical protein
MWLVLSRYGVRHHLHIWVDVPCMPLALAGRSIALRARGNSSIGSDRALAATGHHDPQQ